MVSDQGSSADFTGNVLDLDGVLDARVADSGVEPSGDGLAPPTGRARVAYCGLGAQVVFDVVEEAVGDVQLELQTECQTTALTCAITPMWQ